MKRLLVVTDFQNDFVTGSLGFPAALSLEQPIADKIGWYRASGDDIVFTMDTHYPDYLSTQEGRKLPVMHCIKGTEGHRLYGKIAGLCLPTDTVLEKNTFPAMSLFTFLQGKSYESIEFVGLVSSICVVANTVIAKAVLPETEIFVDASCTAAADMSLHNKALDIMENLQMTVTHRNTELT